MLWDSIESIRAIAGPDYENAMVPEERRKYLARYDAKSTHYEVVSTHGLPLVINRRLWGRTTNPVSCHSSISPTARNRV